jgi:hypothetical protein
MEGSDHGERVGERGRGPHAPWGQPSLPICQGSRRREAPAPEAPTEGSRWQASATTAGGEARAQPPEARAREDPAPVGAEEAMEGTHPMQ